MPPTRTDPEIEVLLAECLERLDSGGQDAVQDFLDAHPAHAPALRRNLSRMCDIGLAGRPAADLSAIPERLGEFRILRRLGGGGMGVVYLAEQEPLHRRVALKLIRPEQMFFTGARARFEREIDAVARLQHPGIVPIYSVGLEGSVPYFAMEWIEGCTLAEVLAEVAGRESKTLTGADCLAAIRRASDRRAGVFGQPVPDEESGETGRELFAGSWNDTCTRIVQRAALAVEHAHQRGVQHRDLKPSNLMVTASGRVVVLDFGLARAEGSARLTRSGSEIGSLVYMAPEQLRDPENVGAEADVYSLGVTLYELLALSPPFQGNASELRTAILDGAPPPLRGDSTAVTWDLETVCLTAIERDKARRYRAMAELARELGRCLAHEPIRACRPGIVLRAARWIQRHPTATVGLVLAFVALVIVPVIALGSAMATAREREEAEFNSYLANVAAAAAAIRLHDVGDARRRLVDAPEHFRNWEWRYLWSRLDGSLQRFPLADVRPRPGREPAAEITPDGALLVASGYKELYGFDVASGRRLYSVESPTHSIAFAMSADGAFVARSLRGGEVEIREARSGAMLHRLPVRSRVTALAFAPGGMLAAVGRESACRFWDPANGLERHKLPLPSPSTAIAFDCRGARLAIGGLAADPKIHIFDATTFALLYELEGHSSTVTGFAFSPDGTRLVSSAMDRTVCLWDLTSRTRIARSNTHQGGVAEVAYAPDGATYASASLDKTIRVFDAESGRETACLTGHTDHVRCVRYAPDGRIVSASRDGTVQLWNPRQRPSELSLPGQHGETFVALAFAAGADRLHAFSTHGVKSWQLDPARLLDHVTPKVTSATRGAIGSSRFVVASANSIGNGTLDPLRLLPYHRLPSTPTAVHVMAGRELALVAGRDGDVEAWDLATGTLVFSRNVGHRVHCMANAADADLLVTAGEGGTTAWRLGATERLAHVPSKRLPVAVAVQRDGSAFVIGGEDLVHFDVALRRRTLLEGHTGLVQSAAFSPDGTRLATGSTDGTVRLWDTARLRQILVLHVRSPYCTAVAWSKDGRRLAAGGGEYESQVVVWTAPDRKRIK